MTKELYRYEFQPDVPLEEVEASLLLAVLATESLHGESQVRLDASHYLDPDRRACVIDAGTPVGRDVNRLFVGFMRREYGEDAFRVERISSPTHQPEPEQELCPHEVA
ncbi:MAG: hypothetical protein ABGZ23_12350 [Fuerstiella sp.]|jgi:hypothetical protein